MRRGAFALLTVLPALLAAGCSAGRGEGQRSADARAERAATVMGRLKEGTAVEVAGRVAGGDPLPSGDGAAIEVLVADGDRFHGRIVLRLTERIERGGWESDITTVRCYEYELDGSVGDPHHVDCPDRAALTLPPPEPEPHLPEGTDERLRWALAGLGDNPSVEQVRAAAERAVGEVPHLDVTEVRGAVGVAVGDGQDECVFARLDDGALELWRVPHVLAQPGELGCRAPSAAVGDGKHAPH